MASCDIEARNIPSAVAVLSKSNLHSSIKDDTEMIAVMVSLLTQPYHRVDAGEPPKVMYLHGSPQIYLLRQTPKLRLPQLL